VNGQQLRLVCPYTNIYPTIYEVVVEPLCLKKTFSLKERPLKTASVNLTPANHFSLKVRTLKKTGEKSNDTLDEMAEILHQLIDYTPEN